MRDLNVLAGELCADSIDAGWGVDLTTGKSGEINKGQMIMLMVTELAEATEGERKDLQDDKLVHRKMAEVEMADTVIRVLHYAGALNRSLTWESAPFHIAHDSNRAECLLKIVGLLWKAYDFENLSASRYAALKLSQVIAACDFYCEAFGYDLWAAVEEKREFNRTRVDHSLEARRAANGKKW